MEAQMNTTEIESTVRKFMADELMFEQADEIAVDETLTLDSLDQTELRVFISETYKVDTGLEKVPPEDIETIKNIVSLVQNQKKETQNN
jgi:acyl carrier protein